MMSEPVNLFHDPLADSLRPGDRVSGTQRTESARRSSYKTTRRYPNPAAARAAALEAVISDIRKLERATARERDRFTVR